MVWSENVAYVARMAMRRPAERRSTSGTYAVFNVSGQTDKGLKVKEVRMKKTTRRDFVKEAATGAVVAAGTGVLASCGSPATAAPAQRPTTMLTPGPVTLKVYKPIGGSEITQLFTSRLADLNNKTIALIDRGWEGARTLDLIAELLERQFPTVKIIPHTQFRGITDNEIPAKVQKLKCDAAILGNAG